MPSKTDVAAALVKKFSGPVATVYWCPYCSAKIVVPRPHRSQGVGRGFGLRTGGAAHSKMRAHIRESHPAELQAETEKLAAARQGLDGEPEPSFR